MAIGQPRPLVPAGNRCRNRPLRGWPTPICTRRRVRTRTGRIGCRSM